MHHYFLSSSFIRLSLNPESRGEIGGAGEIGVSRHAAILAATEPMKIYEAAP